MNAGKLADFFFHLSLRINKNDFFHILKFFHKNRQAHREVSLSDSIEKEFNQNEPQDTHEGMNLNLLIGPVVDRLKMEVVTVF